MTASTAQPPRDVARWRIGLFKGLALAFALFQLPNAGNLLAPWNPDAAPALSGLASPGTHLWHAALPGAVRLIVTGGVLAALLRRPACDPVLVQWLILSVVFTLGVVVPFAGLPPLLFIVLPTVIVIAAYPWPSRLIDVRAAGFHRALAVLTVICAAVLAPGVWQNIEDQLGGVGGEHASEAHWALDAAHAILLLTAGALSSTRRSGWRTLAALTGVTFIYLGIAAVAAPEQAGSWGRAGGALGVLAGIAYLLAAAARRRSATTTGSDDEDSRGRRHRVPPDATGGGAAAPRSPGEWADEARPARGARGGGTVMAHSAMRYRRVVVAVDNRRRVLRLSTAAGLVPGPGEVTVRMTAAGVSYGDILARVGVLPGSGKPGYVPGFDVTGTVEKVGASVAGMEVGEPVTGLLPHGGYAEVVCVPADLLLPLPDGVAPTDAAAAALNYFVAHQMLHRVARPRSGGRILAHGAGSGVGRALVELGRRAGLEVYGTASHAKDEAAALGAIPIDYQAEDFVTVVRDAGGVDAAFDAIGGTHFVGSYRTLRRGGTLVGFGVSSAWSGGKAQGPRAGLSLLGLLVSNILPDGRHARFYTASRAIKRREAYREDLGTILQLLAQKEIHPKIAAVLPLGQAGHAHELVEEGRAGGKVLLTPDAAHRQ